MKVALVHDWLTGMRGGEKLLEVICERYPDADIHTLIHLPGTVSPAIERHRIRTSFIQRLPGVVGHYRRYLPLFPTAIERFRFEGYDLVLSTSHCVAKSAITPEGMPHVCYCMTPMRYAWDQFDAYFGRERLGLVGTSLMRPIMSRLARWDQRTAVRPSRYVAISHYVAGRIRRYYNRDASVVYPPVDTAFYSPDSTVAEGFALIVSALVPYKRIEIAIEACARAKVPLTIVGSGPERANLERMATSNTHFLGRCTDDEVRGLYRRAAVVLLPGEEDFGIVPLEAQACGRPVIALGRGGALETVVPGQTGMLVQDLTAEAFASAVSTVMQTRWDSQEIRRHAERFGRERFGNEIEGIVNDARAGRFA